jgi:hypothetical protein
MPTLWVFCGFEYFSSSFIGLVGTHFPTRQSIPLFQASISPQISWIVHLMETANKEMQSMEVHCLESQVENESSITTSRIKRVEKFNETFCLFHANNKTL